MEHAAPRPATSGRGRAALGLAIGAVAVVAGAPAADAGDAARWRVPAECGGAPRLTARVAVRAGRPLTGDEAISVDVAITRRPAGGYAAAVDVYSVRGAARREVAGGDCAAVLDAVALVLAVAMQGVPVPVDEVDGNSPAPRRPTSFSVGVLGGVDRGALPAAAPGAAVVLSLGRARWRLELGGEVYQSTFAAYPMDDARGVDVGLLGGRARLCRGLGSLRACAGAMVARIQGRPVNLDMPSTESRRWSALSAGVGASHRFGGRFAIGVDVEALVGLDRPEFVVADGAGVRLHRPAAGGVRLGAGLEVEIR